MALELDRVAVDLSACRAPARRGGRRPSGRRRSRRRWSPCRARAGSRSGSRTAARRRNGARSNALTQRFERSAGSPRPPASTENSPASVPRARGGPPAPPASTSKPGPRLAEEAGTRTRRRRSVTRPLLLPLERASHRLRLGRLGRSPPEITASRAAAQPGGLLRGIVVVGVGGAPVAQPRSASSTKTSGVAQRRPRRARPPGLVVEVRARPILVLRPAAHGLEESAGLRSGSLELTCTVRTPAPRTRARRPSSRSCQASA